MYQNNHSISQNLLYYNLILFNYIIIYYAVIVSSDISYNNNYNYDSTPDMIIRAGYTAESHFVTTDDGYILEMHRIPGRVGAIPVFLQHELFGSSSLWLFTGKHGSLAYLLANEGYDVWMGNDRGTTYGKSHINITTEDSKFWKYSQHELGIYDLSAEISYINNFTCQSVIFVGFSMGSPISLIMTSERIDMQSKIRLMIHMAPAVYITNIRQVAVKLVMPFAKQIKNIADLIGIYEIPPGLYVIKLITKYLCTLNKIQEEFCKEIIMSLLGFDSQQFALSTVSTLLNYAPDTTSTMVLFHYAQWYESGHFRQYDYGKRENFKIYNQTIPPDYDLTKIHIPNVIFYAENDWFADPKDVIKLYNELPIKAGLYKINYTNFSHLDFRIATDLKTLLHNRIIAIIKNYS